MSTCREYREEWLRDHARNSHVTTCAECAAWTRSVAQQAAAFAGLTTLPSPRELDSRLERELAGERQERLARIFTSLVLHGAPSTLDVRVAGDLAEVPRAVPPDALSDEARLERQAQAMRALDVLSAPHVLERLVAEELRSPEAARAERFSGSLTRLSAPPSLELRLLSRARRRALQRLVFAPVAALTAAALVVWLMARGGPERSYSFQVVEATSLEGLDPMARQLAQILDGGTLGGAQ